MEKLAKCKVLIGTYINDNIILGGPHVAEFETRDNKFFIKIEQCGYRNQNMTRFQKRLKVKMLRGNCSRDSSGHWKSRALW